MSVDRFTSAVSRFLEDHPAVQDLHVERRAACTGGEVSAW